MQGVLLASDEDLGEKIGALDDGTGVIELDMSKMGNVHTLRAGGASSTASNRHAGFAYLRATYKKSCTKS